MGLTCAHSLCRTDSQREDAAWPRELSWMPVVAQRGGMGGWEVLKGGAIRTHTADSLHCTAEIDTL